MRLLFSFVGGRGHFEAPAAIADAARAAAVALREEIAALPGPERAAALLRERPLDQRDDALA